MHRLFFLSAALLTSVACIGSSGGDTGGSFGDSGGFDTGGGGGFDPFRDVGASWSSSTSFRVTFSNLSMNGFYLGMAETASGGAGWYGEDCLSGNDCHYFNGSSGSLSSVQSIGAVRAGETTLFDDTTDGTGNAFTSGGADRLTYFLQIDGGGQDRRCFVWGDSPGHYSGEGGTDGCTNLNMW